LNILVAVFLAHFYDHYFQKLLKIYLCLVEFSVLLTISKVSNQITYLLIARIEPQRPQHYLQILGLNGARAGNIKEVKSLLDLIFLGSSEHLLVVKDFLPVVLSGRGRWSGCLFTFSLHL
jgi:hypothetical protein